MMMHVEALVSSLEETSPLPVSEMSRPNSSEGERKMFMGKRRRNSLKQLFAFDTKIHEGEKGAFSNIDERGHVEEEGCVECKWMCGSSFSSKGICAQHEKMCPKREIRCPNDGCPRFVPFESFHDHQMKCDYVIREVRKVFWIATANC